MILEIKIIGPGTKQEILNALVRATESLQQYKEKEIVSSECIDWNDKIIVTQFTAIQ